ncbi:hypothetical protein GCM10023189_56810 [Nibrella saemangeumensis]|uniref:histidine kinase n=1 Tax=Nibrella saemangeumensis TaxID=1084526 RepID=A0ABP8NQA6_9BACT
MQVTLKSRLYWGFSLAVALIILIGVLSYQTFRRQSYEADWVKHTYRVINQLENIQKVLLDMEASRRGFRSTNERRFLVPYNNGLRTIGPTVEALTEVVADNPDQLARARQVQADVNGLLQYWVDLGYDAGRYNRQDIVRITDIEKSWMDSLRNQLVKMIESEQKLLTQREMEADRAVDNATLSLVLGTIGILVIVGILMFLIIREFNRRRQAEQELQRNLNQLENLNQESEEKNWLLSGAATIHASMQGVADVPTLAEAAIKAVTRFLDVPVGAFYAFRNEPGQLVLTAAEALPNSARMTFAVGEGLIGQAATRPELYVVKEVPADYWPIRSGIGQARPGEVALVPLWYDREVKGVLELASFRPFDARQLDFLNVVASNIAVALNAADAREKVMSLLEKVQEQKEELENQQEELRQTNEELVRQTEILQSSEEELKVQEEELRQINTELEEKNEAVETARQALALKARELEVTSQYKSEFLANMSHELRTPLNSVLILAKLLAENKARNLTDKQIEYANIINKSGTSLLDLINDILDLAKIEAGKIDLHMEIVPVTSIVEDLKQLFTVVAEQKGVRFVTRIDETAPADLCTDKHRLEQVIKNLLSNAFKFTPKGGTVTLSVETAQTRRLLFTTEGLTTADQVLAIAVTDTGIGIPADKQQLIFEAFQQADGSTSRKYGGTGLGLSIARELIRKLGGEVFIQSESGRGSTFTIYLPIRQAMVRPVAAKPTEIPVSLPALPLNGVEEQTELPDDRHTLNGNDRVMLIIEDDPNFAAVVQDFARQKGYKTLVALRGDEGLYYARTYRPTAITLDLKLPGIDGWQLLKLLKSDETLKHIPVHVISAVDEPLPVTGGATAYLKKPVAKEDLEQAFTQIGRQLPAEVKKVLVLSGNYLSQDSLKQLINDRSFDFACDYAATEEEARQMVKAQRYDCIIADIGEDLKKGVDELQALQNDPDTDEIPVIIYLAQDLSASDELQLKRLSDVIIRDSSRSKERLMDELELFLYKIQETAPRSVPRYETALGDEALLGKKVLLADDDMRNVFALSTLLEEQQMTVLTAGDGKEALELLNQHPDIHIVLMDVMMPDMDGYEATRQIRSDPRFARLPVIALTAKAMPGDREKSLEAGASDYITKPVDSQKLFSLMRVWLSR